MPYTIYTSNGTEISVPDNAIDTEFYNSAGGGGFGPGNVAQTGQGLGTQVIGRNAVDYGTAIAQNFVQLLQNFCSNVVPTDATSLQGQLWFNQSSVTAGTLWVRTTANTSGGITNWSQLALQDTSGNQTISGNLTVDDAGHIGTTLTVGTSISVGSNHVPVVYTATPGSALAGDILVLHSPSTVISIFDGTLWRQVFP
jgi:hypothetical protein